MKKGTCVAVFSLEHFFNFNGRVKRNFSYILLAKYKKFSFGNVASVTCVGTHHGGQTFPIAVQGGFLSNLVITASLDNVCPTKVIQILESSSERKADKQTTISRWELLGV